MYILIYLAIGITLSAFFYTEGDKRAIFQPAMVLFFALLWPLILGYAFLMIRKSGVIRYKGKEIWRAKGRQ